MNYIKLALDLIKKHPEVLVVIIALISFPLYKKLSLLMTPSNDLTEYVVKSMKFQERVAERGRTIK